MTRRERIEKNNASFRFYGAMFEKPEVAERLCIKLPPARARPSRYKRSDRPLERDVLKEIMTVLRNDPRVARVERNQSGVFKEGNRYVRVGTRGKLDITCYLRSGRYIEIECKRDNKEKPTPEQEARIAAIRREGGLAGWAWSAESALALIP